MLGTWTLNASPQFRSSHSAPGTVAHPEFGKTPFDFTLKALVVDDVQATYRPDLIDPVTEEPLSGGATFTAKAYITPSTTDQGEEDDRRLVYKAEIFTNGGEINRIIYGETTLPGAGETTITVEWDGKGSGNSLPGGTEYGVAFTATYESNPSVTFENSGSYLFTITPGMGPGDLAPASANWIEIDPNPYIPYTADELQHTFDAEGDPAWWDDDGDGVPDRFPDHDNDLEPDFQAGDDPPGITIRANLSKSGYDLTQWELRILAEDGSVLHSYLEPDADNRFGWQDGYYEWPWSEIPSDLEPQELRVEIIPTRCRKTKADIQVLGQGTPEPLCGPHPALEGKVQFGEKEGVLEILDASTGAVIATSDPVPYPGAEDALLAALDVVGLGPTLELSASNDELIMKHRAVDKFIKVRYRVPKAKAGDKQFIEFKVRSTVSNPTGFTVNLPRKATEPSEVLFEETFTLTGSGSSGGRSIRISEPEGSSFSTFDYGSGKVRPGADPDAGYAEGDAQDGLEWERGEQGVKLGLAAALTPREKRSKGFRSKLPTTGDALRAGGFESLIFERVGTGIKAWTRVKNQAKRLYISGHGLSGGGIYVDEGSVYPELVGDGWKDSLQLVIIAGCSVLNIGNYNRWAGYDSESPGIDWKDAAKPGCVLLGYNATAPAANLKEAPPSDFIDTRILQRYRLQLPIQQGQYASGPEAHAMAWLVANASMETRLADDACAITDNYYYFIKCESKKGREPVIDPHQQNDDGAVSTERDIYRIHRDSWTLRGPSAWNSIPKMHKKLMRDLPNAAASQSERI